MTAARSLVLGSGIVGSAAAWDLSRRGHRVTVADRRHEAVAELSERFGIAGAQVDVDDGEAVARLMADCDAVVSAVPYSYGVPLAMAAITSGAHYVDFGGNPTVVTHQLQLNDAAAAAGVAVIPDCGLAPGLANVLARDVADTLQPGPIDSVQMRVGALPQVPTGALGYQLTFSPAGLINEYAEPCQVLVDGAVAEVEPLTRFEPVAWEGWGPLEAFATAGGTSTSCSDLQGRVAALEYKTLRYPGHGAVMRAMYELGLFDEEPWSIGDAAVAPRSVLIEALTTHLPDGAPDVVLVRVWATQGSQRYGVEMEDRSDEQFSALARTTALPATALVDLIARNELTMRGAFSMAQAVRGTQLLPELEGVGISVVPMQT